MELELLEERFADCTELQDQSPPGTSIKVIYLGRHGQGEHSHRRINAGQRFRETDTQESPGLIDLPSSSQPAGRRGWASGVGGKYTRPGSGPKIPSPVPSFLVAAAKHFYSTANMGTAE